MGYQQRNDIVTRAHRIIGAVGQGQNCSAAQLSQGADALNAIIEDLNNDGFRLVQLELVSKAYADLTSGGYWTMDADTLDILLAYIQIDGNDEPYLDILDANKYYNIQDKDQTGLPTKLYIDYQKPLVGYLYPYMSSSDYTLKYLRIKKIAELSADDSEPGLEERFFRGLTYMLAHDLSDENSKSIQERMYLYNKAKSLLNRAKTKDFRIEESKVAEGAY